MTEEKKYEPAEIDASFAETLSAAVDLEERAKILKKEINELKAEENALLAPVVDSLKGADGYFAADDADVTLKRVTRKSAGIKSGDLAALRLEFPEAYDEFVKTSESSYWKLEAREKK